MDLNSYHLELEDNDIIPLPCVYVEPNVGEKVGGGVRRLWVQPMHRSAAQMDSSVI